MDSGSYGLKSSGMVRGGEEVVDAETGGPEVMVVGDMAGDRKRGGKTRLLLGQRDICGGEGDKEIFSRCNSGDYRTILRTVAGDKREPRK